MKQDKALRSIKFTLRGTATAARVEAARRILNPPLTLEEREAKPAGAPPHRVRYVSSFCTDGKCRDCVGCYHDCGHQTKARARG